MAPVGPVAAVARPAENAAAVAAAQWAAEVEARLAAARAAQSAAARAAQLVAALAELRAGAAGPVEKDVAAVAVRGAAVAAGSTHGCRKSRGTPNPKRPCDFPSNRVLARAQR
jgi:hypothetical protein